MRHGGAAGREGGQRRFRLPPAALAVSLAAVCGCGNGARDPCAGVECSGRGYCVAVAGSAYCACLRGFHPADLECLPNDPAAACQGVDCSGHGACRVDGDDVACECDPGYRHLDAAGGTCEETECDLVCVPEAAEDAGGDRRAETAGDDAGRDAEAADADAADADVSCDPGGADDSCTDAMLRRCRADGHGWTETPCPLGCAAGEPRCLRLGPSNIVDESLLEAGTVALDAAGAAFVLFDTETGAVRAFDADGHELTPIRPWGAGSVRGINFATASQPGDAPELAIWSFTGIHVPAGTTVGGIGPRAVVLLASGEVRLDGVIDVGVSAIPGFDGPGPAGGAGGEPGEAGTGPGAGAAGEDCHDGFGGGAGGGGHGDRGGSGAGGSWGCSAGAGGSSYGESTTSPLHGGAGGGGAGSPARGGDAAGAVQIVSLVGIRVAAGAGVSAGGGGGGGGRQYMGATDPGQGGGGGGSGGSILLEAPRIEIGGGLAANGGGGGGGGCTEDGGAGSSGRLSAEAAPGGSGSCFRPDSCCGAGGAGGGATSGAGQGGGSGYDRAGGGGGGAAGRIRLNALTIDLLPGGFLSPDESTGLAARGRPAAY